MPGAIIFRASGASRRLQVSLFYQAVLSAGSAPFGRSEESYCSGRGSFSKRAPESRTRRFFLQFLVLLQLPGYAKRLWFLVTRRLIIYYELSYVLLPGSRKSLWYDYCFNRRQPQNHAMNKNKTFLVLMIGAASWRSSVRWHPRTRCSSHWIMGVVIPAMAANSTLRHQILSPPRWATRRRQPSMEASKPSAWNTMSISPPARPSITESAKEPSMAAFLVES